MTNKIFSETCIWNTGCCSTMLVQDKLSGFSLVQKLILIYLDQLQVCYNFFCSLYISLITWDGLEFRLSCMSSIINSFWFSFDLKFQFEFCWKCKHCFVTNCKALNCYICPLCFNTDTHVVDLTLFRMVFFGAAHGWRGGKKAPLPKICQINPTMIKLGTVIPYLKKFQKLYESRETPLEFCWHQHFLSAKMATPGLLKIKIFWKSLWRHNFCPQRHQHNCITWLKL